MPCNVSCGVFNRRLKEKKNFFKMTNLFSLSRKPFVMCYCFREPIKTFLFNASQMTVKSRALHLRPVLQTGRSHIIKLTSYQPRFFGPYCKLWILVFFHQFMVRALRRPFPSPDYLSARFARRFFSPFSPQCGAWSQVQTSDRRCGSPVFNNKLFPVHRGKWQNLTLRKY